MPPSLVKPHPSTTNGCPPNPLTPANLRLLQKWWFCIFVADFVEALVEKYPIRQSCDKVFSSADFCNSQRISQSAIQPASITYEKPFCEIVRMDLSADGLPAKHPSLFSPVISVVLRLVSGDWPARWGQWLGPVGRSCLLDFDFPPRRNDRFDRLVGIDGGASPDHTAISRS